MVITMKKTKKGLTLIEVLVSISVFTIIIFALFSSIVAMRKVVSRQEEAVKIKMVCQDMNVYCVRPNWQKEFFVNGEEGYFLTSDFMPTGTKPKTQVYYTVTFDDNDTVRIVSSDDRVLVENFKLPLKEVDS